MRKLKKITKKWIFIGSAVVTVVMLAIILPFSHLGAQQGEGSSGEVTIEGVIYKPESGKMFVAGATKEVATIASIANKLPVGGILPNALKNNTVTKTVQFKGDFSEFIFCSSAFENSQVTKLLDIPAASLFDAGALRLMPDLTQITALQSDTVFVQSGILYIKNDTVTTLVKVPTNMTTLPANYAKNVAVIATGAFDYSRVSVVDIPSNVLRLESAVFSNSGVNRIILRRKTTVLPADVIAPLTKELVVLVDAKDQASFKEYYNGGAVFLRKYGLYMHPLSDGYDTAGKVHCVGSHISIAGYVYTKNKDGQTITVDLGGGTKLTNVDAWYIL